MIEDISSLRHTGDKSRARKLGYFVSAKGGKDIIGPRRSSFQQPTWFTHRPLSRHLLLSHRDSGHLLSSFKALMKLLS